MLEPAWQEHKGLLSCDAHWAKEIVALYLHFLPFLSITWEKDSISAVEYLVRMKDLENLKKKKKGVLVNIIEGNVEGYRRYYSLIFFFFASDTAVKA